MQCERQAMGSDERAMTISDCHLVVTTEELETLKEQLYSRGNRRLRELNRQRRLHRRGDDDEQEHSDPATMAARWLSELDRVAVQSAVVLCEAPTTRDYIHSLTQFGDGRLFAFTNLDPLQTWSAEDLKKDIRRGFSGLNLQPTLQHFHVYDRRAYGLYEICEQLTVPVTVHFGLVDSAFADMRFANPLDLQPVARDFPEVPFIVPSLGSGFLRELLMLMEQCPNVYADTAGFHLWLRFQPEKLTLPEVVRLLVDTAGASRLLYGSGSGAQLATYRAEVLELQRNIFSEIIPREARPAFFGGTLHELMAGIDREKAAQQRKSLFKLRLRS